MSHELLHHDEKEICRTLIGYLNRLITPSPSASPTLNPGMNKRGEREGRCVTYMYSTFDTLKENDYNVCFYIYFLSLYIATPPQSLSSDTGSYVIMPRREEEELVVAPFGRREKRRSKRDKKRGASLKV